MQSKQVTRLKAGVSYRFVISDRSSDHNFHLTGPRLNRELTAVGYTGTKNFLLKLQKGHYRFFCDPHADFMRGRFLVPEPRPSGRGPRSPPPIFSAS